MWPFLLVLLALALVLVQSAPALAQSPAALDDNAESVAVVIGNKDYRRTVPVDFAHHDAEAMRDFLVRSLGFREGNVVLLKDASLSDFLQVFGTETSVSAVWGAPFAVGCEE